MVEQLEENTRSYQGEEGDEELRPPRPRRELRQGFATGTAAAAAAQGALYELLGQPCPDQVEVALPGGGSLSIPIQRHKRHGDRGEAVVIKDAGDDPDVTNGAAIGARVWRRKTSGGGEDIVLLGGEGVGRVTKPGLPVAVGEPAINPVPRRMIRQSLRRVWEEIGTGEPWRLTVEIFVPRGEELARQTLNPRLGIVGGISVLGTTGLVKPFSHQAYRATIAASLRVARATGLKHIGFSTGGKSEGYLKALRPEMPEEALVQMGDYVSFALKVAAHMGFAEITAAAFFGKALKIAQGFGHTHASRGLADLQELGRWTLELTGDADLAGEVAQANTARQALEILSRARAAAVVGRVGDRMLAALRDYAGPGPVIKAIILDFDGSPLWRGESRGEATA
ncbi:MAG TPA: cobalt-precorrin-5B (C(1))-methyltransferase CbiD [Desulfobaccales bacterium]|nr:cobalt-precorrin-5B (C(1))-methyltransferase CbiD [Desulfobaccales bacterium]